ncbi:hypothetical protein DFP72DRAFT_1049255 [Ephemerocybe angulata]|uniref:DUF6533 domain-containing protein n=1 Tax=Ephemerocybe angulata TaxID=980116 RepID=A0A8H6LZP7_9AGAR|nr:hypothetical protein DFP72DRAFT_1049255 [Tulosesus angulatus]
MATLDGESLVAALSSARTSNYLTAAANALFLVDYLHTLPDEIRYMWPAQFGIPRTLFFALRYYLFAHIALSMNTFRRNFTPQGCKAAANALDVSTVVLIAVSEVILYYRVYAFSGQSRKMIAFLAVQCTGLLTGAFVLIGKFMGTVQYTTFPSPEGACLPVIGRIFLLGIGFCLLLVNVGSAMAIMVYIGTQKYRTMGLNGSSLLRVFYRDSVAYFVLLSLLGAVNIAVCFNTSDSHGSVIAQPQAVIHAILSTRMLLHLRAWAHWDIEYEDDMHNAVYPMRIVHHHQVSLDTVAFR